MKLEITYITYSPFPETLTYLDITGKRNKKLIEINYNLLRTYRR